MSGKLPSVDIYELYDLGDAAIPAMVELKNYWSETDERTENETTQYYELRRHINQKKHDIEENEKNIWEISVPYLRAKNAIELYYED